ncbi:MAG: hypothetical protein ABI478_01115 [Propionivibrio sp.]
MEIPDFILERLGSDAVLLSSVATAYKLCSNLCENAQPEFFPEYTDHGPKHVNTVIKTAIEVLSDSAQRRLTPRDWAALTIAVLLHDLGMHLTRDTFQELITSKNTSLTYLDITPWSKLWSDFLLEARRFDGRKLFELFGEAVPISDPPSNSQLFTLKDKILIGEFLRRHHPRLAHEIAIFGFPTIQSRMAKSDPEKLVLDYTRTMMGFLLFQPRPQRIAMIGLGGGSLAKYCHRHLADCDFSAIELSPAVIALRDVFAIPPDSASFRVLCADGAHYVRDHNNAVDALLVDGFDRRGQPASLCSAGFYENCRTALRPGGVLVVNLCADDAGRDDYIGRIERSFAGRVLAIDADEGDNVIVFAGRDAPFPPSLATLTARLRELESRHAVDLDRTAQKILDLPSTRNARARATARRAQATKY